MSEKPLNSSEILQRRCRDDLAERGEHGRLRKLRVAAPVRVNLADNDYLGLAHDPAVKAAARAALDEGPVSASSSPLVRGYQEAHARLEAAVREWHGFAHALVWNSGFAANQAVLGTLAAPGDVIYVDRLAHHSLLAGVLKSGAKFTRFVHNDLAELEELLEKTAPPEGIRWVVTESVFSMDGDGPDLARLAELKRRHGFVWMLDEAHALGWYGAQGQGRAAAEGVTEDVDILIGTLGKALGGMGAYALFHDEALRESLINHAGEFIYSTYLSPMLAAAAVAAIARVRELAPSAQNWRAQSRRFREALRAHGWDAPEGDSPIVPVPIGADEEVVALGEYLLERGYAVGAIRPPTVPEGTARLRLSLKAGQSWADLEGLLDAMEGWRATGSGANKRSRKKWLWISGWAVPPAWLAEQARTFFPGDEHVAVTPSEAAGTLASLDFDALGGYSLGALWLLRHAWEIPAGLPVILLAPFFAFPIEMEGGGRVPFTQLRAARRRLRQNAPAAVTDFFRRAEIAGQNNLPEINLITTEQILELDDELSWLETWRAIPPAPAHWQGYAGEHDTLIDAGALKKRWPALHVVPDAGHAAVPLLRAAAKEFYSGQP